MSQPQTPAAPQNTARLALALGIVGLILGASGLGYALYLGLSQVPSQLSSLPQVNQRPGQKTIRVEWTTSLNAKQDRFYPNSFTVNQGDNVTIILITNDTSDGHTFTMNLALRGLTSVNFQLNNSWKGLTSGPYIKPFHPATGTSPGGAPNGLDCCLANGGRYNPEANFTGPPTGCTDQNGASYTCNTQIMAGETCNAFATITPGPGPVGNNQPPCDLWSTSWMIVTVPGVYKFLCFFHQSAGMIGYLTVLPNAAYTPI